MSKLIILFREEVICRLTMIKAYPGKSTQRPADVMMSTLDLFHLGIVYQTLGTANVILMPLLILNG